MHVYLVDGCQRRGIVGEIIQKLSDARVLTLDLYLHSFSGVQHPAGQLMCVGNAMYKGAKAYALHDASHHDMGARAARSSI